MYTCNICGKNYKTEGGLKRHENKKHQVEKDLEKVEVLVQKYKNPTNSKIRNVIREELFDLIGTFDTVIREKAFSDYVVPMAPELERAWNGLHSQKLSSTEKAVLDMFKTNESMFGRDDIKLRLYDLNKYEVEKAVSYLVDIGKIHAIPMGWGLYELV
jgi:hypothetical protein